MALHSTWSSDWFVLACGAAFGCAAALIGGVFARMLASIPPEDRQYKDKPPLGFRLVWWPIHWIAVGLAPLVPAAPADRLPLRLRKAGLAYSLSAPQFVAAQLICALLVAGLFAWILDSLVHGWASIRADTPLYLKVAGSGALFGWLYPAMWLHDRIARRRSALQRTLPFYLDVITLCVEAGLNLQGAMLQAVEKGPPGIMRDEFQNVLCDIRAGRARAESMRAMADRVKEPGIVNFVGAVVQAERAGINLGPVLRAQADQRRSERFLRAEKLAMEAPVKLLLPLIAFIFPCTFIVLFFPIVMKLRELGI